jgi:hypothetical protein
MHWTTPLAGFSDWLAMLHPEDRARAKAASLLGASDGKPYTIEYRVCLPDGQVRWLCAHGLPMRSQQGAVESIFGVSVDISKYKQLETEIVARDVRMRDACLAAGFFLWELDLQSMECTLDRPVLRAAVYAASGDQRVGHFIDRPGRNDQAPPPAAATRAAPIGNESFVGSFDEILRGHHEDDRSKPYANVERLSSRNAALRGGHGRLRTRGRPCHVRGRQGLKVAARRVAQHRKKSLVAPCGATRRAGWSRDA